jgi:hypothetical protein
MFNEPLPETACPGRPDDQEAGLPDGSATSSFVIRTGRLSYVICLASIAQAPTWQAGSSMQEIRGSASSTRRCWEVRSGSGTDVVRHRDHRGGELCVFGHGGRLESPHCQQAGIPPSPAWPYGNHAWLQSTLARPSPRRRVISVPPSPGLRAWIPGRHRLTAFDRVCVKT